MRIGIVGASSLLGKELAEELGNSIFAVGEVVLLDEEKATGQIAAVGDEAAFIRRIEPGSFQGLDLVFFAGRPDETTKHWMAARKAGASVIDLTGALAAEPGVAIQSPWVLPTKPDLATTAIVPAHIVSVILALVASRCSGLGVSKIAATVLLPASERGQAGMDEMHEQTVKLLSFQSLPTEEFDTQVAFNLLAALGPAAKMPLEQTAERIRRDYARLGTPVELSLQIIQAPVFHGYGISVLLESGQTMTTQEITESIDSAHITVLPPPNSPSNLIAAGRPTVLARVDKEDGNRAWLWMIADNIKLTSLHAIACAADFRARRLQGKVQ
ncbi:Asd/ArgC dimerization domain-containing protein [Granulicella sibirica]|uniref:Aspartate-semialdehyde dehydrogenase n=1 Tax=Granulicella sibirica TaxID=2479048 RepID=A0A4Q0T0L3_9BACT|nr:Asd/ArgC dimerization domain-containing protein [Granulicella sibirica]RXH56727.1 Aspartate-semialdehyde dehydrogenase [Granulicella sibirica]